MRELKHGAKESERQLVARVKAGNEEDESDSESENMDDNSDELSYEAQDAYAMDLHEKQMGILMNCLSQGGDTSYVGHVVDAFWDLPRVVCLTDLSRQITSIVTEPADDDDVDEADSDYANVYSSRVHTKNMWEGGVCGIWKG